MSESNYIRDKRLVSNHTLRQVVIAGNILAHRLESFVEECVSLGAPDAAEDEINAIETWRAMLAQLRGEVQP